MANFFNVVFNVESRTEIGTLAPKFPVSSSLCDIDFNR